ncbi:hypothetical protein ACFVUY_20080 [Kitasatospora sp. NPDC058063]|uniref:hypothetical protein n=1 Tax=unclassified Kitasatospora TaxID=2633591 RepID=UPI0036DDC2C3
MITDSRSTLPAITVTCGNRHDTTKPQRRLDVPQHSAVPVVAAGARRSVPHDSGLEAVRRLVEQINTLLIYWTSVRHFSNWPNVITFRRIQVLRQVV